MITQSSRFGIRALPNKREAIEGLRRRIHFSISVNMKVDGSFVNQSKWSDYASFTDDSPILTLGKFFTVKPETQIKIGHHRQILI